jgi:hypothetical protein
MLFKGRLIMKHKRRERFGLKVFFPLSGQNKICLERAAFLEGMFAKTCEPCAGCRTHEEILLLGTNPCTIPRTETHGFAAFGTVDL